MNDFFSLSEVLIIFNSISELLIGIAQEAATYCMFIFFEPEIPKSLREE